MKFCAVVLAAIAFALPALSARLPLHTVEKFKGETTGKYIVELKAGVSKDDVLAMLNVNVTHAWNLINGFAGHLNTEALEDLRVSPYVKYIAEDGIVHAFDTQTDAPWGLERISQPGELTNQDTRPVAVVRCNRKAVTEITLNSALTHSYTYDETAGAGVDIYVIGKYCPNSVVVLRGAPRLADTLLLTVMAMVHMFPGPLLEVAKAANIIAVKVLSDAGSGSVVDILSGLDWVASSVASSGRPSIASLSLGGAASAPLDNGVTSLVNAGIHVTVAAGNSNTDAGSTSPARAKGINTVGASTIADTRASFSNYGPAVDVFAPGQNIISAWIGNTTATNNISGTSMATPHVAGLIAYIIGKNGDSDPATMTTILKTLSVKGALGFVPSGTLNDLIQNVGV